MKAAQKAKWEKQLGRDFEDVKQKHVDKIKEMSSRSELQSMIDTSRTSASEFIPLETELKGHVSDLAAAFEAGKAKKWSSAAKKALKVFEKAEKLEAKNK